MLISVQLLLCLERNAQRKIISYVNNSQAVYMADRTKQKDNQMNSYQHLKWN
jgi:hypothetical protein